MIKALKVTWAEDAHLRSTVDPTLVAKLLHKTQSDCLEPSPPDPSTEAEPQHLYDLCVCVCHLYGMCVSVH